MKILAVEFSSARRSVAFLERGDDGATRQLGRAVEADRHATGALSLVEQVLNAAGIEREQIDCVAVGLGPGSYVGIRSAIAVAQGWQLACEVRLLGVSSAECLAAQAQAQGWHGRANVVIDAQRNELYLAGYEISAASRKEVEPLRLASVAEAAARALAGQLILGPEVNRWFPSGKMLFPEAAMLAQLAAGRTGFLSGEKLEPIYLRETSFVKAPPAREIL